MYRRLIIIIIVIGLAARVRAQTDTPTPTETPTPTVTYTPTPDVAAIWTLPPPEATDELGAPVGGQPVQFVYSIDAGDFTIALMLFAILLSLWILMFLIIKGNNR